MREAGIRGRGARCGALLVSLLLSGALPLLSAVALEREHRCACHHAIGEVCYCPGCRRAAENARRAQLESMPPCHRAAAAAALASDGRGPLAGTAVVTSCCDTPERLWMALQASDPYLRSIAAALKPIAANGRPPQGAQLPPGEVPREIPTPPPRLA